MSPTLNRSKTLSAVLFAATLALTACSGSSSDSTGVVEGAAESDYLADYTIDDAEYGTQVDVSIEGTNRVIVANALPNHDIGEFPNDGNPHELSAQDVTYEYTTEPTFVGGATTARTTGVAINGLKFEGGTGASATCEVGGNFRLEALQDAYDLGLDFNNAHVQPTGEIHYHGLSKMLAAAFETDDDLVHMGFAADGYLMYYSKSGAYKSGYELTTEPRTGTDCFGAGPLGDEDVELEVEIEGTIPDGTYTSDWVWSETAGDLDSCNGVEINGTYAYMITEEFPYISRCLNGEVADQGPPG